MNFLSREEVDHFIQTLLLVGQGSQGVSYKDKTSKKVYKFYHDYLEDDEFDFVHDREEILQFKDIPSSTFLFPKDVILLNDRVIGDITSYRNARNLYQLNPLTVNLDRLLKLALIALKGICDVSKRSVNCFDMMYNILLGRQFYIIDTLEYTLRDRDYQEILRDNVQCFNLEILYFLVDGLFYDVIKSDSKLYDLYESKGRDMSIVYFIIEFRKRLSELLGHEIVYLADALSLRDINENVGNLKYERDIMVRERVIRFK